MGSEFLLNIQHLLKQNDLREEKERELGIEIPVYQDTLGQIKELARIYGGERKNLEWKRMYDPPKTGDKRRAASKELQIPTKKERLEDALKITENQPKQGEEYDKMIIEGQPIAPDDRDSSAQGTIRVSDEHQALVTPLVEEERGKKRARDETRCELAAINLLSFLRL